MATTSIVAPGRRATRERRSSAAIGRANPLTYVVAILFVAANLAPVLYIVLGGFRTNSQITTSPAGLPAPFELGNYGSVLGSSIFWQELGNSAISAIATTVGVVVLGLMVSYILARYRFAGRGALYALFAAGLMFPITVAITPLYLLIKDLGLTNSLAGVILPQIAFALPTTVIILVPFLRAIPDELEEAASIDGASRLGFFFRMIVPLSLPGVVTVGILAFIASWNSYILPLFILNNEGSYTLPLGVQAFSSQYSVDTAKVLAFTSMSMIPALIFFTIFQRRIVGGLTGAVKG
ncbi:MULTISPECIES: carbohydrate ABC transporter permease [unclassified Curtobacterium]|uniref:carbohydrate ABC transporter permease n=1 Tax=unclassified Curtobacterium TaxID=257496 RepID=UPI000D948F46|nr:MULTISPECIES: carbohydrate ABC transporter permease [unclassified Curtobacterium]PYY31895.1 carbohydrate ABC transporter permease [Curtobacterium sp. MCBD17_030]PZE32947.1 carbohydrate ABC transporter permease [Curtobacterium sp. MCPF17_031]PZE58365.1 carbohydrate ABC transporter permease [Curtobacterium sp. MCPF17_001]PZF13864.1 carbohydrate ABC transporter permease [Curtobacterium sp. MCPF17_011]PZF64583.1 carbohydrate ABC transporter permease [Curtobacterium sp. MCPF17_047]